MITPARSTTTEGVAPVRAAARGDRRPSADRTSGDRSWVMVGSPLPSILLVRVRDSSAASRVNNGPRENTDQPAARPGGRPRFQRQVSEGSSRHPWTIDVTVDQERD